MARHMPEQKPGKSVQEVETPEAFIEAVEKRWGKLDIDLACSRRPDGTLNAKAERGLAWPETDSLAADWTQFADLNCWLNPEYARIGPWAAKCAMVGPFMRRGRIFMLVPASIGANWYRDFVRGEAMVEVLESRIKFVGHLEYYPKDLVLAVYAPGMVGSTYWDWKGGKR